jgi:beta-glucanase (GH16 family)
MKRLVLACALGGVAIACQVARKPAAQEIRLRETSKRIPPPVRPATSYAVDSTELLQNARYSEQLQGWLSARDSNELVPSQIRPGQACLRVNGDTVQKLAPTALLPGRSYRLKFTARLIEKGAASIAIKFRRPANNETVRTFSVPVASDKFQDYSLEFTAPAYTAQAELAIELDGTKLLLDSSSLQMRPALIQTEAVTSWGGSFVPPGYALVFNDEFNGTELNRRRWFTRFIYSSEKLDRLNDENQRYSDDGNHRVSGGILSLVAKRLKLARVSGINFESGMIRSDWTVRYGFFEARVKMPGALGVWPAFWLNSDIAENGRLTHPPEIDFFEFVNNGKDDKVNKIHFGFSSSPGQKDRFLYQSEHFVERYWDYVAPFNFNEGWHTIGSEWTPEAVTMYVDGLKIVSRTTQWKYKDGSDAGPAHLLFNLAVGGKWAGRYGIDDAAFPQSLAIDWVRVYQKEP